MSTNKNLTNTAEKIKSLCMGFVGAGLASLGISYLNPLNTFLIPKFALSLYENLGNIGFASVLILLGIGIMSYAFVIYKRQQSKLIVFILFLIFSMIMFYFLTDATKQNALKNIDNIEIENQLYK